MENTPDTCPIHTSCQDHLHLRGEYAKNLKKNHGNMGSSPLTWRIPPKKTSQYENLGIISTYVENTLLQYKTSTFNQDHLHLRGEYNWSEYAAKNAVGSSPLTWRIQ